MKENYDNLVIILKRIKYQDQWMDCGLLQNPDDAFGSAGRYFYAYRITERENSTKLKVISHPQKL